MKVDFFYKHVDNGVILDSYRPVEHLLREDCKTIKQEMSAQEANDDI